MSPATVHAPCRERAFFSVPARLRCPERIHASPPVLRQFLRRKAPRQFSLAFISSPFHVRSSVLSSFPPALFHSLSVSLLALRRFLHKPLYLRQVPTRYHSRYTPYDFLSRVVLDFLLFDKTATMFAKSFPPFLSLSLSRSLARSFLVSLSLALLISDYLVVSLSCTPCTLAFLPILCIYLSFFSSFSYFFPFSYLIFPDNTLPYPLIPGAYTIT